MRLIERVLEGPIGRRGCLVLLLKYVCRSSHCLEAWAKRILAVWTLTHILRLIESIKTTCLNRLELILLLEPIVCHWSELSLIATHKRLLESTYCTVLLRLETVDSLLLERTLGREFLDWLLKWRWTCTNCKACCIILSERVSSLSNWRKRARWVLENLILLHHRVGLSNIASKRICCGCLLLDLVFCRFLSEWTGDYLFWRS